MDQRNMPEAFLCRELKDKVENLRNLVKSTMEQVHSKYSFRRENIKEDRFQEEVIKQIKRNLKMDDFSALDTLVEVWANSRGGTIKKYFDSRLEIDNGFNSRRFLKIATRGNSLGDLDEILEADIEPWVDRVGLLLKKPHNVNYLSNQSTKKQVLINLKSMLDYPISVKETSINNYASEDGIETLVLNEPQKYLPSSALKILENNPGMDWKNIAIVTANVLEYDVFDNPKNKKVPRTVRIEGRVKSSEALKLAKYVTGIRDEPMYDGIGVLELGEKIEDIYKHINRALLLKNNQRNHNLDYRFPTRINEKSNSKALRASFEKTEKAVIELLKTTYLVGNNEVSKFRTKRYKDLLVYGAWLDMNLKSNKSPIEIQFKDALGFSLYSFNSPFGHNSKAYNERRTNELYEQVKIKNKEYSVDKITNYVANDILLPAFLSSRE